MSRGPGRSGWAWRKLRAWVLDTYTHCRRCHQPVDKTLSGRHPMGPAVDHIHPIVEGGEPLDRANLCLMHTSCNLAKEHERRAIRRAQQSEQRPSRAW